MYELRILNGYHRGALLPLGEEPYSIGAGDDAAVVLLDPGIADQHAVAALTANGWTLTAVAGEVRDAHSNQTLPFLKLPIGGCARAGSIWLTVSLADAPWQDAPCEPADAGSAAIADSGQDSAAADAELDAGADIDAPAHWFGRRIILIPLVTVAVLSAATAYAITDKSVHAPLLVPEASTETVQPDPREAALPPAKPERAGKVPKQAHAAKGADPDGGAQAELREAFRKRLAEVDLAKRFNLRLEDNSWSMEASLDDEEAARFQRILKAFMRDHHIAFPVHARIGSAESMLPFKIQQVISGSNASIVTQDGMRLYVGEEYRGVRLASIEGNQLRFTGNNAIDITW